MSQVRRFSAFVLAALALFGVGLAAQSGDTAAIQQKLNSQFKVTTMTADRSDIVTAGDVVQIHRPGLVMYAVASPMPPSNTYKNGKIGQGWGGFGKDLMIGMATPGAGTAADYPHRTFVAEEKCWVTAIQVQKDGVLFQLYSDPYDDVRYYANLKIPFADKKTVPQLDAAMQLVAEVLTVAPQDQGDQPAAEQDNQAQQTASSNNGAQGESATSVQGKYLRSDKKSDFIELDPSGNFLLIQNGKPYAGTYHVDGETLMLASAQIRGQQKCRLVGNTMTDSGGTIWEKPAPIAPAPVQAPASATVEPATLPDIAPPPPPADTPPPTIALGQTKSQVIAAFGQPTRLAKLGAKEIFYYKDMKVTLTSGKVSNVE